MSASTIQITRFVFHTTSKDRTETCQLYEIDRSLKFFAPDIKPWHGEAKMKLAPLNQVLAHLKKIWKKSIIFRQEKTKQVKSHDLYFACRDWVSGHSAPLHGLYDSASHSLDAPSGAV